MLVTQADYTRWQNAYEQRYSQEQVGAKKQVTNQVIGGQEFALESGNIKDDRSTLVSSESGKSFLEEAFELTLNHRLGIDQEKMDEIKEEIEKTEAAIEALNKEKPHTEKQQKELQSMEDKLKKLEEALDELVRLAAERANGNIKPEQRTNQLVAQYQSVASFL